MIKNTVLVILLALASNVFAQQSKIASTGVLNYQIIAANTSTKKAKPTDLVEISYRMAIASTDSLLTETFTNNQPTVHIPVNHPSFKDILLQVKPEDRVNIIIIADSFYKHTINKQLPAFIKKGDSISFYMKVFDVLSTAEMVQKQTEADKHLMHDDSIAMANYINNFASPKRTNTGLYLIKTVDGNGVLPKNGDKVLIKYRAYLFDGAVIDKSPAQGYEFTLGNKQVIKGLEEAVKMLKVGSRYKVIVPHYLAYGGEGSGGVPAYSSVVFDVEILGVNNSLTK